MITNKQTVFVFLDRTLEAPVLLAELKRLLDASRYREFPKSVALMQGIRAELNEED